MVREADTWQFLDSLNLSPYMIRSSRILNCACATCCWPRSNCRAWYNGWVMTIGFSITGCSNSKNRFDERTQDWLVKKFGLRRPRRLDANRAQPHVLLVCYTAVFSVVTQRSSPQTARSVAWRHQTRLCSRRPFSLLNKEENKRRFCWQSDNVQLWERNDAQNLFKKYLKNV